MDIHADFASADRKPAFARMEECMFKNLTTALTVAGAIAATGFTPATAGPIPTMTAAVAQAAPAHAIDIYWRGGFGWRG